MGKGFNLGSIGNIFGGDNNIIFILILVFLLFDGCDR